MYLNHVVLGGNLTRDPELDHLPSGTPKARFSIAQNEKWKDKDGNKKEKAHFFECEVFGKTSEVIAEYFSKGDPIIVIGRNDYQSWEKEDGSKRSVVRIKVQSFEFVPRGNSSNGSGKSQSSDVTVDEEDFEDIPF